MAAGDIIFNDGTILTPADLQKLLPEIITRLNSTAKDPGDYEEATSLQGISSIPTFFKSGNTYKLVRTPMTLLKGADGREVEMIVDASTKMLKYHHVGDTEWTDLYDLSTFQGESAYQLWQKQEGNAGKTEAEYIAFLKQPATEAGAAVTDQMAQITQNANEITTALSNFGETAVSQETARVQSEQARKTSETSRVNSEETRQNKETERQNVETVRVNAETERVEAEQTRVSAENSRNASEKNRTTAEAGRETSETSRVNAETARVQAETLRQTNSETAITNVNAAKDKAIEAADHPTFVGTDMYVYEYDMTTHAYVKTTKYVKGDQGDPLTWDDLTEAQKASLKGEPGSIEQGDAHNLTVSFAEAETRTNIVSGETIAILFGKIKKWFSDLKAVAFTGSYTDLTNKPTIPAAQVQTDWNATSGLGVLLNKPTIPTNNNELTNGAGYITKDVTDLANYYTVMQIDAKFSGIDTILNNIIGE